MKDKLKLSIFWIFSFIVIIFMMTFTTHAQGLPVYVDNESFTTVFGLSADQFINAVNGSRFAQSNGVVLSLDVPGTFIYNGVENGINYTEIFIPTSSYSGDFSTANGVTYDTWNSSDNFLSLTSNYTYYFLYERDNLNNALLYYYGYGNQTLSVNFYGSTGIEIGYLVSDYNWSVDPSLKIATNISIPVIDVGVAIVPPTPLDPSYLSGDSAPLHVPTSPNITNYTWTTPPTFDNSSVINGIQSIKDTLEWLATNIQGAINNLLDNIKALFEYIGQTLQYYGNMIIQTLNNLIQNFYDNMKSLVENISNNIAYAVEPLDQEAAYDTFSSTSFNTDISAIHTNFNSFFGQFSNISEPTSYKIPIHFENISMFSDVGIQYLDLGWLDSVKTPLRAFLWCITTYGLIAGIFDAIPNYINGGGGEDD